MATDGIFRPVYEGCIAGCDSEIDRRPYHRNCGCALHKSRRQNNCSHAVARCKTVSYPIRRSWSEGCLTLAASASSSPSSSPVVGKSTQPGVNLSDEEDDGVQYVRNLN